MNLREFFQATDKLKNLRGIEAELRQREKNGLLLSVVTVAAGIIEVIRQLADSNESIAAYFTKVGKTTWDAMAYAWSYLRSWFGADAAPAGDFTMSYDVVGIYVVIAGIIVYFVSRHTAFLFETSKEPFQYTFWISPFTKIDDPASDAVDAVHDRDIERLLHHDLMAMLNQRIGRFSLLEDADATAGSHIHVEGSYAIRARHRDGRRVNVIQIMPMVRIGPAGSPSILTQPVEIDLPTAGDAANTVSGPVSEARAAGQAGESTAEVETETGASAGGARAQDQDIDAQVREQVYSRVASEIYRQIRVDIEHKLRLFPTRFLRSVALYHEAEDFARSNTIDSYDYAIELFRASLRYYDVSLRALFCRWLAIPRWLRFGIDYELMRSRTKIAYARSLIYRRIVSSLTGRAQNPLYEIPSAIGDVAKQLTRLHNKYHLRGWKVSYLDIEAMSAMPERDVATRSRFHLSLASVLYRKDSWVRKNLLRRLDTAKFDDCRRLLFDAYVVMALAYAYLDGHKKARFSLEMARATYPDRAATHALYLLTLAATTADLEQKAPLLLQAAEINPHFEIAQYLLAENELKRMFMSGELGAGMSLVAIEEFNRVLTINPGNVAAYANLGNLDWLIGNLEHARWRFEQGIDTKTAVQQTFIGELAYGLARIAARRGEFHRCRDLYSDALSAEPGVGIYAMLTFGKSPRSLSYYDFVSESMLDRYRLFRERFEEAVRSAHLPSGEQDVSGYPALCECMARDRFKLLSLLPDDHAPLRKPDNAAEMAAAVRVLLTNLALPDRVVEREPSMAAVVHELKKSVVWLPDDAVSTIRLNRGLLDKLYPAHFRPCEDSLGQAVSVATINATYSFVLNDYANAFLNYYHRCGDVASLQTAADAYDRAIALKPDNAVAYYNRANATLWLGDSLRESPSTTLNNKLRYLRMADRFMSTRSPAVIIETARDQMQSLLEKRQELETDLASQRQQIEQIDEEMQRVDSARSKRQKELLQSRTRGRSGYASQDTLPGVLATRSSKLGVADREVAGQSRTDIPVINRQRSAAAEARTSDAEIPQAMGASANELITLDSLERKYEKLEEDRQRLVKKDIATALDNARKEFEREFKKSFSRAMQLSKLSALFDGIGFDPRGGTIAELERLGLTPAMIDATDLEALTGWATLLSIDKTDARALENCLALCNYIEKFEEDTFNIDQIRLDVCRYMQIGQIRQTLEDYQREELIDYDLLPSAFRSTSAGELLYGGFFRPSEVRKPAAFVAALVRRLGDHLQDGELRTLKAIVESRGFHRSSRRELRARLAKLLNGLLCRHFVDEKLIHADLHGDRDEKLVGYALEGRLRGLDLFRFNRQVLESQFRRFLLPCRAEIFSRRIAATIDEQWLTRDPVHHLALTEWARSYLSVPEIDRHLQEAIRMAPPHVDKLHDELARLYQPPRSGLTDNELARLQERCRGYEDVAEERLRNLTRDYPDRGVYRLALARFLSRQGRFAAARQELERAESQGLALREQILEDTEDIYRNEVDQLAESGDYELAIEKCREGLQAVPGSAVLESLLASQLRTSRRSRIGDAYGERWAESLVLVTPLAIEVAADLIPLVEGPGQDEDGLESVVAGLVTQMRTRIEDRYGVRVPGIRFRGNDTDMPPGSYLIYINEVPVVMGTIDPDRDIAVDCGALLERLGLDTSESATLAGGETVYWIASEDRAAVQQHGVTLWPTIQYVIRHLENVIVDNLAEFVGHQELFNMLSMLDTGDSQQGNDLVEKYERDPAALRTLLAALRGLLDSRVPIREFAKIVEFVEAQRKSAENTSQLVTRLRMLPEIRPELPGNAGIARYWRLGRSITDELSAATVSAYGHAVLAMAPETCQECLAAVRDSVVERRSAALIVDNRDLRPLAQELFGLEFPDLPVIAREEIMNFSRVAARNLGTIELS